MTNFNVSPTLTFCGCGGPDAGGCSATVADAAGLTVPSHDLADNYVFDIEGDLDYIELFVREHVVGRTLRDKHGAPYLVRSNVTPHVTPHAADCRRVWGRYDASCARCSELKAGAAPRPGWGGRGRQQAAQRLQDIRQHDCRKAGCGPVCTAFDW